MTDFVFAEVKSVDTDNPDGAFEAILSMPTLDLDGEIVDAKAFDPLPSHIPIDFDHGFSVATTIGSGVPTYEGDVLTVKGTFSSIPRAQEVRTLVKEGHIRAMSVKFWDPVRVPDSKGVPHVTKAILLNAAFVPVGANRDAAVVVAKSGARNSAADAERMQTIHDLSVSNGAFCEKSHAGGEAKSPESDPEQPAATATGPLAVLPGTATARAIASAAEAALI